MGLLDKGDSVKSKYLTPIIASMTYPIYSLPKKTLLFSVAFLLMAYNLVIWGLWIQAMQFVLTVSGYRFNSPLYFPLILIVANGIALLACSALVTFLERYAANGIPLWVKTGLTIGGVLCVSGLYMATIRPIQTWHLIFMLGPLWFCLLCFYLIWRLRASASKIVVTLNSDTRAEN